MAKEISTEVTKVPDSPTPWERQEGESSRAFEAFVVYRDLPAKNRAYNLVVDALYTNAPWAVRTIQRWATAHGWEARVTAWENQLDRAKRDAQVDTVKLMTKRHLEQAMAMQAKGLAALNGISESQMTPADARLLITEGIKAERLARGQSTEKIERGESIEQPQPDLSDLSDEELTRMAELADRVTKGSGETASD